MGEIDEAVGLSIAANTTFTVAEQLETTQVPDGVMIYQSARDRVHYLNPTAAIVLELCGMGKTRAEIESFLNDGFALEKAPTTEVEACLRSLIDEGLVAPS